MSALYAISVVGSSGETRWPAAGPHNHRFTIRLRERIREGFGLVEIKQHSVFTSAPPGLHLRQFAGRVDNPNGVDPFKRDDYFTPNTACRAQIQDSRSACSLFFN